MQSPKNVNYSYWELDQYFKTFDLIVVGSGIVGLSTAISFKQKNRRANVLILEKGFLPSGASTKNAGFACFGSPSEILDDLEKIKAETVWATVKLRWEGLKLLRKRLGDKNIDYHNWGGYELFDDSANLERCRGQIPMLNKAFRDVIGTTNTYGDVSKKIKQFRSIKGTLLNKYEGQINTGLMMRNLIAHAHDSGILILNNVQVDSLSEQSSFVEISSGNGVFRAGKVVVAINGFAKQLLKIKDVEPARAQVLITRPIPGLKIKGTFHYQQGYYYFRNIGNRVLFGGGRNLDKKTETTTKMELNEKLQDNLDEILKTMILPGIKHEVEHRWAGIMGVGSEKKPIIEFVSPKILAAVRMGGMGVAIGSKVGEIASEKISNA